MGGGRAGGGGNKETIATEKVMRGDLVTTRTIKRWNVGGEYEYDRTSRDIYNLLHRHKGAQHLRSYK